MRWSQEFHIRSVLNYSTTPRNQRGTVVEGSGFKIVFNVSMAEKCNRTALKINRKLYLNHENYITAALSKCTALSF